MSRLTGQPSDVEAEVLGGLCVCVCGERSSVGKQKESLGQSVGQSSSQVEENIRLVGRRANQFARKVNKAHKCSVARLECWAQKMAPVFLCMSSEHTGTNCHLTCYSNLALSLTHKLTDNYDESSAPLAGWPSRKCCCYAIVYATLTKTNNG